MCTKLQFLGYYLFALVAMASAQKENSITISYIFKPEDCTVFAVLGDEVAVHYILKLKDGTVIKSSYEDEKPTEFVLGDSSVILGLSYGVVEMCVGEKRKIHVPPAYGYGEAGKPPAVPAMAYLDIEAELVHIAKPFHYMKFLNDKRLMVAGYMAGLLLISLIILCKCLPNLPSQKRKAATKAKKTD